MKSFAKTLRVAEGDTVDLGKWPTAVEPVYGSHSDYAKTLAEHVDRLSDLQQLLYASDKHAVLLIFQAMDAAGKDGVIRHVMSGVNPQGCQVTSFKHPSATEMQHDFLWRSTRRLPERGQIGIFNRSYYEEVLIARVHPEILATEDVADDRKHRKGIWHSRYRSIVDLEHHLARNGTRIIKFYLVSCCIAAVSVWTPLASSVIAQRWFGWPNTALLLPLPVASLAVGLYAWHALGKDGAWQAFAASVALFALSFVGVAVSLWPMIVPGHFTLWQAASPESTQAFLLVDTLVLLPVILFYTGWSYWVFRGKVRQGESYHTA